MARLQSSGIPSFTLSADRCLRRSMRQYKSNGFLGTTHQPMQGRFDTPSASFDRLYVSSRLFFCGERVLSDCRHRMLPFSHGLH
jgi:hypothetical protein